MADQFLDFRNVHDSVRREVLWSQQFGAYLFGGLRVSFFDTQRSCQDVTPHVGSSSDSTSDTRLAAVANRANSWRFLPNFQPKMVTTRISIDRSRHSSRPVATTRPALAGTDPDSHAEGAPDVLTTPNSTKLSSQGPINC